MRFFVSVSVSDDEDDDEDDDDDDESDEEVAFLFFDATDNDAADLARSTFCCFMRLLFKFESSDEAFEYVSKFGF